MRGFWLLPAFWLGCSAHEGPAPASAPDVQLTFAVQDVTAPCPLGAPPSMPERDGVFIEALIFDAPTSLATTATSQSVSRVIEAPSVRLLGSPHLMADMEHQSAFSLVDVQGYSEEATLHAVSMTPHRADEHAVLDLALTLQLPNRERKTPNPTREVRLTLASKIDAPLVATAPWDERNGRSLLVVLQSHRVRGSEDFRRIFECKMRRRAELLRRTP